VPGFVAAVAAHTLGLKRDFDVISNSIPVTGWEIAIDSAPDIVAFSPHPNGFGDG